jgi:hypothetical protein
VEIVNRNKKEEKRKGNREKGSGKRERDRRSAVTGPWDHRFKGGDMFAQGPRLLAPRPYWPKALWPMDLLI